MAQGNEDRGGDPVEQLHRSQRGREALAVLADQRGVEPEVAEERVEGIAVTVARALCRAGLAPGVLRDDAVRVASRDHRPVGGQRLAHPRESAVDRGAERWLRGADQLGGDPLQETTEPEGFGTLPGAVAGCGIATHTFPRGTSLRGLARF